MLKNKKKKTKERRKTRAVKKSPSKLSLMKAELNYFKGLSIIMLVMIVCIFFAFGALFSAMYMEVRMMRVGLDQTLGLAPTYELQANVEEALETAFEDECCEGVEKENNWLSFEKYGVNVSFPPAWTFLDKPFQRQLHFYADGNVREEGSSDIGDLAVVLIDKDNYQAEYERTVTLTAGRIGFTYLVNNSKVTVVPAPDGYVELRFVAELDGALIDSFLEYLEFSE